MAHAKTTASSALAETRTVVTGIATEADGVVSVRLAAADGGPLPAWEPGAHIDLLLSPGMERQYSLCGDPEDTGGWRVAVLREPESRGGSQYVHEKLTVGDHLTCRGPRNNFPLVEAGAYLFIAGGIGITPLLPMAAACEAAGRPWRLVYGGRTAASMAFTGHLAGYGPRVELWPQDTRGLIDLGTLLAEARDDTAVYCCGPRPLLDAVQGACAHWPEGALHVERFRPRAGALDGRNTPFQVVLEESGLELTVPADRSVVDVLEEAGVRVPTSCREGTCGTCETVVLEGTPDHRDSFLTPQEKDSGEVMMVCCSRALGDVLVLDL
ncbi:PDR/VanB family oxidoreductase [Streptomyces tremellae]|uniref:PDR/VanB family oxidoreductase n=1 Tax=Streptomyces tremellae TaxID=1124239 RepID=A0ABP7ECN7_9ACTN